MTTRMIWTDAGHAAQVNAEHTGTLPVQCKYVALGTGTTPAQKTDTALQAEIKRVQTIGGQVVAADTIHVVLRDESADVYAATEVGLLAADGTLLARYAQAQPLLSKAAGAVALLAIDAVFADVDATQISFGDIIFVNPPWSETVPGVVQRATQAQAEAGTDAVRGMSPLRTSQLLQAPAAQARETRRGTANLATLAQAQAGTDDSTIMTPVRTLAQLRAPVAQASAVNRGAIQLASQAEAEGMSEQTKGLTARLAKYLVDKWAALTLKGGAYQDLQNSATDTTPGRLLAVGAFGLGAAIDLPASTNLNSCTVNGAIYSQALDANASAARNYPVARAGRLIVTAKLPSQCDQIYVTTNGSGIYYRGGYTEQTTLVWTPWRRLRDSDSLGDRQVFTSSGTFTVPAYVSRVWISGCAGGGGGMAGSATGTEYRGGAGGQAGEVLTQAYLPVTPGEIFTITIGAGGAPGGVGGATHVSSSIKGVLGVLAGGNSSGQFGGRTRIPFTAGAAFLDWGGQGQSGPFGVGGRPGSMAAGLIGGNATGYGSGGGGGGWNPSSISSQNVGAGGRGAPGFGIIEW